MKAKVDVLLTPADLAGLAGDQLRDSICVVFDVLRATSTLVTALHHGAEAIHIVGTLEEALAVHTASPQVLLAGERGGMRIRAAQTGSIDFHLGNSPREFTRETVAGKTVVMTTTNGTQALLACKGARKILAGSFLNLAATARGILQAPGNRLRLICAGTGARASYEDALGAGALLDLLPGDQFEQGGDSCLMARLLSQQARGDLRSAFQQSQNGRRLAADPDLASDLDWCTQLDMVPHAVEISGGIARLDHRE